MTELFSHPSGAPVDVPLTGPSGVYEPFTEAELQAAADDVALLQEESDPGPVPPQHEAPPMPVEQPLTPMAAGTFAFYDDGAGGAMLVMQPAGGEVLRKHIPANMVRMIGKFTGAGGGIGSLLGMFGGR